VRQFRPGVLAVIFAAASLFRLYEV
jgi:hypothetical protein